MLIKSFGKFWVIFFFFFLFFSLVCASQSFFYLGSGLNLGWSNTVISGFPCIFLKLSLDCWDISLISISHSLLQPEELQPMKNWKTCLNRAIQPSSRKGSVSLASLEQYSWTLNCMPLASGDLFDPYMVQYAYPTDLISWNLPGSHFWVGNDMCMYGSSSVTGKSLLKEPQTFLNYHSLPTSRSLWWILTDIIDSCMTEC